MGVAFENKALEERPIQVESFALFNSQPIIIDFGAQLPTKRLK